MVALTFAFSAALPDLVELPRRVSPVDSGSRADHPLVLAIQAVHVCCYAVAAVRLTLGAWRQDDELLGWLGAAAALGAFSRLNYVFLPTTYTTWVSTGDLLRLGFVVLLLVGAVREIRCFWVTTAAAAAEVERRRLARDLHDGVLQELGYIRARVAQAPRARATRSPEIGAAAERAVGEARGALAALTSTDGEDLPSALVRAACEVWRPPVRPAGAPRPCSPGVPVASRGLRDALLRIAREAVSNASRHAPAATGVHVRLAQGQLTVQDDGHRLRPGGRAARPLASG